MFNMSDIPNTSDNVKRVSAEKIATAAFLLLFALTFALKIPRAVLDGKDLILFQAIAYGAFGISGAVLFRREIAEGVKSWRKSPLKNALWVIGAFLADLIISNIAVIPAALAGLTETPRDSALSMMIQMLGKPLAVLAIGLFGPVMEESVYRLFLIGKAKTKIPLWVCVIVSSLLFAFTHLNSYAAGDFLSVFLPVFATGLIYGIVYAKTGNITLTLILHVFNNAIAVALLH